MELNLDISWIFFVFLFTIYAHNVNAVSNFCLDHGYTPPHGSRSPEASDLQYFEGSLIRYFCDEKYKLNPNIPVQNCTMGGNGIGLMWMPPESPSCVERTICQPPTVENGAASQNVYYEDEILLVRCEDGFQIVEDDTPLCLSSGNWSSIPFCAEKNCSAPPDIPHSTYNSIAQYLRSAWPWVPGMRVVYTCDRGYEFEEYMARYKICRKGEWTGTEGECVLLGCYPPETDDQLLLHFPNQSHYDIGSNITYFCNSSVTPHSGDFTRKCVATNHWSGKSPSCADITTVPMPYTSVGNVFCTAPLPISHGSVFCCNDEDGTSDATKDPMYCCSVNGIVQFICNEGYSIEDDPAQWVCGPGGEWMFVNYPDYGHPVSSPTCGGNTTRTPNSSATDEMLKPVFGTAGGVLLILLIVILVAFCRPKLKDMKRRWREMREDEEELIIDGRRIILPSYEEAVASPHDPYFQLPHQSNNTEGAGPSHINIENGNNQGSSSRDDVSLILEVHAESTHSRFSSSSDEEILIPNREGETNFNLILEGEAQKDSPPSILELKNSITLHDRSLDDKTPEMATTGDSEIPLRKVCENRPENNENTIVDVKTVQSVSAINPSESCESLCENNVELSSNDSEACLEVLRPRNIQTPAKTSNPMIDFDHTLLTFPLRHTGYGFTVESEIIEPSDESPSAMSVQNFETENSSAIQSDKESNVAPIEPMQDDLSHLSDRPDHVCLVSTSTTPPRHSEDATNSTAV